MFETALNNPTLTDAEKRNVQQQAQSNDLAAALGVLAALLSLPKRPPKPALDPETADLTEEERLARLKQSRQYQAYQERMQAWRQQQERERAEREFLEIADLTEEERLARLKQSGQYQAYQERMQAAAVAYQSYRQGEREYSQPTTQPQKPWWQRAIENVKTFVQSEAQKFQTWNTIRKEYGWTPIGIFSQNELNIIAETGKDISTYVNTLSPGNGQAWVKAYLPAVITHWTLPPIKGEAGGKTLSFGEKTYSLPFELPAKVDMFGRPMGLPGMVILPHNWGTGYTNPKSMPLAHHLQVKVFGRMSRPIFGKFEAIFPSKV